MYVVYGKVDLQIINSASLKNKRKIINSIISRIQKRFNISICEVDYHDLWQRSLLGFAAATRAHSEILLIVQAIEQTIINFDEVIIINIDYDENKV